MNHKGLKAIEVVGVTSYDDRDEYGHSDILVFVDGGLAIPGTHYTFDGSKLEFHNGIRSFDVMIYSRTTGSFRIIPAVPTVYVDPTQEKANEDAWKEAQEEKKDAVKEAVKALKDQLKDKFEDGPEIDDIQIAETIKDPFNVGPAKLSEDEINDITISQLGTETELKEAE